MACSIHIVSGFLGSGKTTLLNCWLKSVKNKRVGIIVNDFGSICIDGSLINANGLVKQTNLSGGQIFCSCLSGSFVSAIKSYEELNLDLLLVEASGLAKPSAMKDILAEVFKSDSFEFGSYITTVDTSLFIKLRSVVNAVEEQVIMANTVLLTKTDLVSEDVVEQVKQEIKKINPEATILKADMGNADFSFLEKHYPFGKKDTGNKNFKGWGEFHRPSPSTIQWNNSVTEEKLMDFLGMLLPAALRVKGFVNLKDKGTYKVDATSNQTNIDKFPEQKELSSLVIIRQDTVLSDAQLEKQASKLFGGKIWINHLQ